MCAWEIRLDWGVGLVAPYDDVFGRVQTPERGIGSRVTCAGYKRRGFLRRSD